MSLVRASWDHIDPLRRRYFAPRRASHSDWIDARQSRAAAGEGEGRSGALRTSPEFILRPRFARTGGTNLRRKRTRPLRGCVLAGAHCVAALDRWTPHRSSRRSLRIALARTQRRLFLPVKIMLQNVQGFQRGFERQEHADMAAFVFGHAVKCAIGLER